MLPSFPLRSQESGFTELWSCVTDLVLTGLVMFDLCAERLLDDDEVFAGRNGHRFVEMWAGEVSSWCMGND